MKVQESEGGIVPDIGVVEAGHDSALLVSSIERHIDVFGVAPIMAATDRGFLSPAGEQRIQELGVRRTVIPHTAVIARKSAWRTSVSAGFVEGKSGELEAKHGFRG